MYVSLNEDQSCFCVGTTRGFSVYDIEPLQPRINKKWDCGVGIVELVMRSNILALVGGGPRPKFPPNRLVIWDDFKCRVCLWLSFSPSVRIMAQ